MKRNPQLLQQAVQSVQGKLVCDRQLIIEFPRWYADKGLYSVDDVHHLYGVFAVLDTQGHYAVSVVPTVVSTAPLVVGEVERDGMVMTQLLYAPGSALLETNQVIKQPFLTYNFFDGYFLQAKIPWFIEYEDLLKIMDYTVSYADTNLGENQVNNEVLVSFVARAATDKRRFYRQYPQGKAAFVDLMDVRYSALNTLNKLAGNYFNESVVSALVQKSTKETTLERHVRA